YAASVVVATGVKYYPHHFVFALPLYVTLFFLAIHWWSGHDRVAELCLWAVAILSSCFLVLFPTASPLWALIFTDNAQERGFRATAAKMDALMDACKYQRYLSY